MGKNKGGNAHQRNMFNSAVQRAVEAALSKSNLPYRPAGTDEAEPREAGKGLKNHASAQALIRLCRGFWSWPAILFAVGSACFTGWSTMIGANDFLDAQLFFVIGTVLLAGKTIHWANTSNKFEDNQRGWASLICGIVFICVVVGQLSWINSRRIKSEHLHVSILSAFITVRRSQAVFLTESYTNYGHKLTPVNVALWLVVMNRSKDPLWIGHAVVEYRSKGILGVWHGWEPLYVVNPNTSYYNGSDLTKAPTIIFPQASLSKITQDSLVPEKAYPAYGLYQYPDDRLDNKPFELRIRVCDIDGYCSLSSFGNGNGYETPPLAENAIDELFRPSPPLVDISRWDVSYIKKN